MQDYSGVNPPPDMAWQIGKTAASIRCVKWFETKLKSMSVDDPMKKVVDLFIEKIKNGTCVISKWDD